MKLTPLQTKILSVMDRPERPMFSVYTVCDALGLPQGASNQKFYVSVYRALEKLVKLDLMWVMRGVRDPSVYLAKSNVRGFDQLVPSDIPF